MQQPADSSSIRPTINVTPLVDVVLVLLIIFMVIAPTLAPDVVRVPVTDRPTPAADDGPRLEVVVATGGRIWIDGRETTPERFAESIRDAAAGREELRVVLKGDAALAFGEVEQAMRAIEAAGFEGVGLVAQPTEG